VTAKEILSGLTLPPAAAEPLYEVLAAGLTASEEGEDERAGPPPHARPVTGQPAAAAEPGASAGSANPFTEALKPSANNNSSPEIEEGPALDSASAVEI
jgi:hypothetical protein